jgi:hypothetical protein
MNFENPLVLADRIFEPGEPIPLVQFMYEPFRNYYTDMRRFTAKDVGSKFPKPTAAGDAFISVPGSAAFISLEGKTWVIHFPENNLPVAIYYPET